MPRNPDPMTPPGARVAIVVGRWRGHAGTVAKRNGKSTVVALHGHSERAVRDWSGNVFIVREADLRAAAIAYPATSSVVPHE